MNRDEVTQATDLLRKLAPGFLPYPIFELAFERILHDELKDTSIGAPHYVGSMFHDSKRGAEQAQLYWVEVIGEPAVGKFYNAYSLPSSLIDSQRAFIDLAASNFQQYKMKES
jgi:hypothetical protein